MKNDLSMVVAAVMIATAAGPGCYEAAAAGFRTAPRVAPRPAALGLPTPPALPPALSLPAAVPLPSAAAQPGPSWQQGLSALETQVREIGSSQDVSEQAAGLGRVFDSTGHRPAAPVYGSRAGETRRRSGPRRGGKIAPELEKILKPGNAYDVTIRLIAHPTVTEEDQLLYYLSVLDGVAYRHDRSSGMIAVRGIAGRDIRVIADFSAVRRIAPSRRRGSRQERGNPFTHVGPAIEDQQAATPERAAGPLSWLRISRSALKNGVTRFEDHFDYALDDPRYAAAAKSFRKATFREGGRIASRGLEHHYRDGMRREDAALLREGLAQASPETFDILLLLVGGDWDDGPAVVVIRGGDDLRAIKVGRGGLRIPSAGIVLPYESIRSAVGYAWR